MCTLLDTASDFANAASVDRIGFVPPADPMNCATAETAALAATATLVEAAMAEVAAQGSVACQVMATLRPSWWQATDDR